MAVSMYEKLRRAQAKQAGATAASQKEFQQQNAYQIIAAAFNDYGLGTLAPKILELVQQGYNTESEITMMLRETTEYKTRFAANEARAKKGLSTLSPAEYVAQERQYAQVMRAAGLPTGFYDSVDDYRGLLERDVSINEVQQRAQLAQKAAFEVPAETRQAFLDFYGIGVGELTAYFLDPEKGTALIERQSRAADIAGAQKIALGNASQQSAERLADLGVTDAQARQGYQQIADLLPDAEKLSSIYGDEGKYDLRAAESEVFGDTGGAAASKTRKGLASRERAAFSGSSGTAGADSLSTRRKGSL